jgi:hypothetical protein
MAAITGMALELYHAHRNFHKGTKNAMLLLVNNL